MNTPYEKRPFQTQLLLDQLFRCYRYPRSFYEKMSDREIHGFHKKKLPEMVRMTIDDVKNPQPRQLRFF